MCIIIVFIDFSVAFNSVYTSAILSSLVDFDFSPHSLQWIASSFTGRTFSVVSAGSQTDWIPVDRGFAQGIKAGGLYFLASMNRLPSVLDRGCRTHLYADDTTIEKPTSPSDLRAGITDIQASLENFVAWSSSIGLNINPDKSTMLYFGLASQLAVFHGLSPKLRIGQRFISASREVRHLGVWLDETFSWNRQARSMTSKVMLALRSIAHLRSSLDLQARQLLVRSLAAVHLDYCASLLNVIGSANSRILQVSLNSCVRFICKLP